MSCTNYYATAASNGGTRGNPQPNLPAHYPAALPRRSLTSPSIKLPGGGYSVPSLRSPSQTWYKNISRTTLLTSASCAPRISRGGASGHSFLASTGQQTTLPPVHTKPAKILRFCCRLRSCAPVLRPTLHSSHVLRNTNIKVHLVSMFAVQELSTGPNQLNPTAALV